MPHHAFSWSSLCSHLTARGLVASVGLLALAGCAQDSTVGGRPEAVVYGDDDRLDVYEHPSAALRDIAHESIVALMASDDLIENMDGTFDYAPAFTLQEAFGLCDDQRFLTQPTSAFCSGTLVAPDVIVTAGHCIETMSDCLATSLVFDYLYTADGELAPLDADDVYTCVDILSRELGALDYAYLRLDRPVVGHSPATLAAGVGDTCRNVVDDEPVSVLGFGSGLPLKIDDGGTVTDASSRGTYFFDTSLDTFGGNSGSGVFNADNELVGVLSSGAADYVTRTSEGCDVVNELANSQGGEEIGHVLPTLTQYCDEAPSPDATLCALAASSCPDGGGPVPNPSDGSGCSAGATTGSGAGPLGLLALVGLVLGRRARRRRTVA
ncbi:MAG: trypsin-like peptidase domain-containing protein [Myxococcales bacterium]|nr:trypsin-like peptidase domain-containing protein [Myxococcales bacterium]